MSFPQRYRLRRSVVLLVVGLGLMILISPPQAVRTAQAVLPELEPEAGLAFSIEGISSI